MRLLFLGCSAAILLGDVALANRAHPAVYRYSGRPGESSLQCLGCHNSDAVPAPAITVDGTEELRAGDTAVLTLTINSFAANPEGRIAGYVATTDGAGVFAEELSDGVVDRCAIANGVKHRAPEVSTTLCDGVVPCPSFFSSAGSATYTLTLAHLQEGDFTLFVAANDANNNRQASGDHGAVAAFPLRIGPAADGVPDATEVCGQVPEPSEAEETPGDRDSNAAGCAGARGPSHFPVSALTLLLTLAALDTRRKRQHR
ncbi:MAG: choice-of-anchor V domain-containing protein [Myxococcota bacterium]